MVLCSVLRFIILSVSYKKLETYIVFCKKPIFLCYNSYMKSLNSGNLKRDFFKFIVPCVINLIVFSLYSIVDGIFVSRYVGAYGLASINICHPFLSVLFCIGILLAVGASTLIADALGRKDTDYACFVFSENLIVTVIIGIVISALVYFFLTPFSMFLGADADTYIYTREYLGTLGWFSISFILEYSLEFLVKTDGNPILSLVAVISSSLINIFLDYVFVAVFSLGVFGAALATGISQVLATVVFLAYILTAKDGLFTFKRFKWDFSVYKKLIPLGVADGSLEICSAIILWIYNRIIRGKYGADGIAAYTVVAYVNNLVFNMEIGVSQGMQPLVSYYHGAKDKASAQKLYKHALVFEMVLSVIVFACVLFFAGNISQMFIKEDNSIADISSKWLRIVSLSFPIIGFNIVSGGYLTAMLKPRKSIIISLLRAFFAQVIVLFTLYFVFGAGSVFYTAVIAEFVVLFVSISFVKKV